MAAASGDDTPRKSPNLREPWKPGQSGNPAGRPKGARAKLGEAFVDALLADFRKNGVQSIVDMRDEKPADYVKVIASILPKELSFDDDTTDALADIILQRRKALQERGL